MYQTIVDIRLSVPSKGTAVELIAAIQAISGGTTPDQFRLAVQTVQRILQGQSNVIQMSYRDRKGTD